MAVQDRSFEDEWPELSRALQRILASRGIDTPTIEDLTQETGLRLFSMWAEVDFERPIVPLAATIALNLLRDQMRKQRVCSVGEVPDLPGQIDVERMTIARLDLHRAAKAVRSLSPLYRDALLGDVVRDRIGPLPSSTKMARMRARRKLSAMLGTASSLWGWLMKRAETYAQPAAGAVLAATIITSGAALPSSAQTLDATPETRQAFRHESNVAPDDLRRGSSDQNLIAASPATNGNPSTGTPIARERPMKIPLPGGGEAQFGAQVQAGGVVIRVGDSGGAMPVCMEGFGSESLECKDAPAEP